MKILNLVGLLLQNKAEEYCTIENDCQLQRYRDLFEVSKSIKLYGS